MDVELRCTIAYVDAQGLADLSSVKTILEAVQPKKLVVINGDEQTSKMFRAMCQSSKHQEIRELMMPQLNVSIDASFTTDIVRVVLTDSLVSSLRTATVKKKHCFLKYGFLLFYFIFLLAFKSRARTRSATCRPLWAPRTRTTR